jgi:hypothetical protein
VSIHVLGEKECSNTNYRKATTNPSLIPALPQPSRGRKKPESTLKFGVNMTCLVE